MLKTLIALAAACSFATPCAALTVIGTGTGKVYSETGEDVVDWYGLFGSPGASLLGKAATISIRIDIGSTPPINYADGSQAVRSGFWNIFPANDPLRAVDIADASITIGGVTVENDGSSLSSYSLWQPSTFSCQGTTTCVGLEAVTGPGRFGPSFYLDLIAGGFASAPPSSLSSPPFDDNLCDRVADCRGAFLYQESTGDPSALNGSIKLDRFSLLPSSVPEPSTWLLMIAGFFAAGAGLRRAGDQRMAGRRQLPSYLARATQAGKA